MISTVGTALLALVGLVVAVVIATPLRMRDVLHAIGAALRAAGAALQTAGLAFARFWRDVLRAIMPDRADDEDDEDEDEPDIEVAVAEDDVLEATDDEHGPEPVIFERTQPNRDRGHRARDAEEEEERAAEDRARSRRARPHAERRLRRSRPEEEAARGRHRGSAAARRRSRRPGHLRAEVQARRQGDDGREGKAGRAGAQQTFIKLGDGDYQLPSIQLLNYDAAASNRSTSPRCSSCRRSCTQTLENYGVKGDVVAIRPGPVVTMYEFAPAPGTRVNKIVNLTDDLAMALEALRVRIVAPIPGKAAVGIEVPNQHAREGVPEGDPRRRDVPQRPQAS